MDTDYGGFSEEVPSSDGREWEQVWREDRIDALLDQHDECTRGRNPRTPGRAEHERLRQDGRERDLIVQDLATFEQLLRSTSTAEIDTGAPLDEVVDALERIANAPIGRDFSTRFVSRVTFLTWTVEGAPTDVGPGEALLIPRGAVHHFDNTRDVDAKALAIVTPGILGPHFFREVAAILDAAANELSAGDGDDTVQGGGPPDLAAIAAVMGRHGLTAAP